VTGAYINAALANDAATQDGYDEAFMLSVDGQLSEASSSNFFMVRDGMLITTPVTSDILEGVTRRAVLQLATDLGIPSDVRQIDRTELYVADEIFLAGTGAQIASITSVDRRTVGKGELGPITKSLQEVYYRAVRGLDERYIDWVTPVY
jgi:branched-chain amino acid aminotransferase